MTIAKTRALIIGAVSVLATAAAILVLVASSCACRRGDPTARTASSGQPSPKSVSPVAPGTATATSAQTRADRGGGGRATHCSPTASRTTTNTVSHLCGFADTTNTGPPAGTTLYQVPEQIKGPTADTGSGWTWNATYGAIYVEAGGAVKNIQTGGAVEFFGDGGRLENSDLRGSGTGSYMVQIRHASNVVIKNNNIHGRSRAASQACDNGIRDIFGDSENLTVENNNIWYCATGMNNVWNGGLIQQNYIHDLAIGGGYHVNGIQLEPGTGRLMTVRDNTIFNPQGQTDAIMLANDNGGAERNRLIEHNLLAGGGYCFYGGGRTRRFAANITFTSNHLSRLYYPACGFYGWDAVWYVGNGDVWSANVWDDTGAPVQPR